MNVINIILFGPPGSGKGTQSEKLINKYQLIHLSTGDILRSEIAQGTELGVKAKTLMDAGNLVPDEVVIDMIASKIDTNKNAKGFIFDGFPRTVAQAQALDNLLEEKELSITNMLALKVPNEELKKRLLERGKISGRPDDADENIIANRISVYNSSTLPVANHYKSQDKFVEVEGVGTIEEIFDRLTEAID